MTRAQEQTSHRTIEDWLRFLRAKSHVLLQDPGVLLQEMANQPDASLVCQSAIARWHTGVETRVWMRHLNKPQVPQRFDLIYSGHKSGGQGGAGSSNWVTCCKYSPDGSLIASADFKGLVHLWDVETGELQQVLAGHNRGVSSLAWSPAGLRLVAASWGELVVWEVPTGSRLCTLRCHPNDDIQICAWSPDGLRIVSSCDQWTDKHPDKDQLEPQVVISDLPGLTDDEQQIRRDFIQDLIDWHKGPGHNESLDRPGETQHSEEKPKHAVVVWNANTGEVQRTLLGHSHKVVSCSFSPDGSRLVSSSGTYLESNEVILWDLANGTELRRHLVDSMEVPACLFIPRQARIAFVEAHDTKGALVVMDGDLREVQFRIPVRSPGCLAVSPDGAVIAVGSRDHFVYLFDALSGQLRSELAGHGSWVEACDFSPSGDSLVTGSRDCTARIWSSSLPDESDHERENRHLMAVRSGAFSGDGGLFVSGSESDEHSRPVGSVRLWDAKTGDAKGTVLDRANDILKCAFLPDNRRVLASTGTGYFEIPGFRLLDALEGGCSILTQSSTSKWYLDTGTGLLCRFDGGRGEIIDVNAWDIEYKFSGAGDCVFDAERRIVVTGGPEHRLMLVDLVTNESRAFGPAFRDEIDTVIMSPDKESVVVLTAGHVGEFPLLDIQREAACLKIGANYPRLHLEGDDYRTACYCGDLLAISADGKLLLHDPASGALTATLLGHSGKIVGAACVGDKPWLVTISLDMTVRLWDVQTLGPMGRFFLRGRGTFVAVSPDGSTIAAGDELGYVYLLQICGPRRKGSVEVTDSFVEFSAPAHGSASLPTPSEDWFVVGDLVFEGDPGPPAREIQCRRCGDKMIVDGTDWLHRRYPTACDSCGYQGA